MAGYSDTPLLKKLGIKEGFRCVLAHSPKDFKKELGSLPPNVSFVSQSSEQIDFILLFAKTESLLANEFTVLASKLKQAGMLWVGWPKKSSGVATDLTFDKVQRIGLDSGLVDVKICAINDIWSGLKFVVRVKDRALRK